MTDPIIAAYLALKGRVEHLEGADPHGRIDRLLAARFPVTRSDPRGEVPDVVLVRNGYATRGWR
jgi:hypothetical protein